MVKEQAIGQFFRGENLSRKDAMEMVCAVIWRQSHDAAIERKDSLGDTVGITPDKGAKETIALFVTFQGVITEDNVYGHTMFVRHPEILDRAAVIQHAQLEAGGVAECPAGDGFASLGNAEKFTSIAVDRVDRTHLDTV